VLHAWQEDLDRLTEEENQAFAEEFVTESFRNGMQPYNYVVQRLEPTHGLSKNNYGTFCWN
jgi:hypothetical protein